MVMHSADNREKVGSIPTWTTKIYSGLAQLVEHTTDNRVVTGSNPVSTTKIYSDVAKLVKRSIHNAVICGFESHRRYQDLNAGIAQLASAAHL